MNGDSPTEILKLKKTTILTGHHAQPKGRERAQSDFEALKTFHFKGGDKIHQDGHVKHFDDR